MSTKSFTANIILESIRPKFKFYIGGSTGLDTTTPTVEDYTQKLVRASYTKTFGSDYDFDAVIDDIDQSDAYIQIDSDVYFVIDDGADKWLLMKGYINDINWTSEKRVQIIGKQSMRSESGSSNMLSRGKLPEWTQEGEITLDEALKMTSSVAWYGNSKSYWDDEPPAPNETDEGRKK